MNPSTCPGFDATTPSRDLISVGHQRANEYANKPQIGELFSNMKVLVCSFCLRHKEPCPIDLIWSSLFSFFLNLVSFEFSLGHKHKPAGDIIETNEEFSASVIDK